VEVRYAVTLNGKVIGTVALPAATPNILVARLHHFRQFARSARPAVGSEQSIASHTLGAS
jgi:hypothetical protein